MIDDERRMEMMMMSKRKRTKRILVDMSLVAWLGLGLGVFHKVICFLLHYARNGYDNFS
jgi:hypothetical protein